MKKIVNRIIKAAEFYVGEATREGTKELQVLRGVRGTKPMISYMGWTGHNNLGDEILYEAHVALFTRTNMVPYRKSALLDATESVRKQPLYIAGFLGGGTLINQSDSWLQRIAYLQFKKLPIYCLGTGVTENAFRHKHENTSMDEWVKTLNTFSFVGIRGPYSERMLKEAGFKDYTITGDTALALARSEYKTRVEKDAVRGNANKVVGLNYGLIKDSQLWGDATTYTNNIMQLIKELINEGYSVKLLPVWDKDIASNRELLRLVNDSRCTMKLAFNTLAEYQAELDSCHVFIGQKLHATIMATMERIPSIMVEYNPKCRDYMASVSMEHCVIKTSDCQPENVLKHVAYLEDNYSSIQDILDERIMHYRTLQFKTARRIEDELLSLQ